MLRNFVITGTAIGLAMVGGVAKADHDDALRYVVGGAIIGAALGELAYAADYRAAPHSGYAHYAYRRGVAHPPPRFHRPGRGWRERAFARHRAYRHRYDRGHRHGAHCW